MQFAANARALRLAGVLVAVLAFAACAKNPADDASLAGAGGAGMGGPGGAGYAAPGSPQDFVVNVGDRVFFDSDSVELTPTAQATLEKQARWLQQYNRYAFTIEGHADERGTREYNFALGSQRAEATKNYLAARGISPARMHTVSYGKERPVAVCNDISCWSQNRRAVTVLNGGQS
jgi:peptidoglycan-associated lipoprotein